MCWVFVSQSLRYCVVSRLCDRRSARTPLTIDPIAQAPFELERIDGRQTPCVPDRYGLFVLKYQCVDPMNVRTGDQLARSIQKFGIDSDHGYLAVGLSRGILPKSGIRT